MTPDGAEAYPLAWPAGWPRTRYPMVSKFYKGTDRVTLYVGRDRLLAELRRLGATQVTISSNIPTRLDGLPYSSAREPADHGIAVYFRLKGQPRVLACDRWIRCADNMVALAKHVEAIRGQARWGVGSLEQAFSGYLALAAMSERRGWHEVLGIAADAAWAEVEARREELLIQHHPDRGGNANVCAEINAAFDEARRARGDAVTWKP